MPTYFDQMFILLPSSLLEDYLPMILPRRQTKDDWLRIAAAERHASVDVRVKKKWIEKVEYPSAHLLISLR